MCGTLDLPASDPDHTTAPNSAPTPPSSPSPARPRRSPAGAHQHAGTAGAWRQRRPAGPGRASERGRYPDHQVRVGCQLRVTRQRQHCTDGKTGRRGQCRLHRARAEGVGDAEFVARVGTEGVVLHQLFGHLLRQGRLKPARDVDRGQLALFGAGFGFEFGALARQVGLFRCRPANGPRRIRRRPSTSHRPPGRRRRSPGCWRGWHWPPPRRPPGWPSRRCRRWHRAPRHAASRCGRCGGVRRGGARTACRAAWPVIASEVLMSIRRRGAGHC